MSACGAGAGAGAGGGGGAEARTARLVDTYSADKAPAVKRRQLPLLIYDNLTMIMDLNSVGLVCDNPQVKGRDYEEFMRKYKILTPEEVKQALWIDVSDVLNVLNQSIPCIGCRRSVERLFFQLCESGHPTLDPLVVHEASMTIREDKLNNPQSLATLLHGHSSGIEGLVDSQHRLRKSRRCALHSLDAGGVRGWGCGWSAWGGRTGWRQAWDAMRAPCRDHVTLIHFHTLHDTLHNYLRKHRFCADCKTKVLRAYQLLVEEKEPQKEKGYVGALYGGIKRCLLDKHLHLQAKTEYIAHLIARAEPELLGNHRERHAKTLEIAQEEVLICLGICVYERLHRISLRLREEEGTCQALAAVAVEALYRKFEMAVEQKSGVSKLELLYEEITQEEVSKQQRKEQKKLRKRKRKQRQAEETKCKEEEERQEEDCQCEECLGVASVVIEPVIEDIQDVVGCHSCQAPSNLNISPHVKPDDKRKGNWSSSEHSQDCGYSSENNHCCETVSGSSSIVSSPEGSEVACSEGCCNHDGDCSDAKTSCKATEGFTMSLEEMLLSEEEIEEDECLIPLEDLMEFKSRHNIKEKRQELRETLRQKFDQLCVKDPPKTREVGAGDNQRRHK